MTSVLWYNSNTVQMKICREYSEKLIDKDLSWTFQFAFKFDYLGGTLLAGQLAMEHGIACSTGGGTHHAFPSHGAGYCLLNDLAVTAAVMFKECQVKKVLIVDLDVHQVFVFMHLFTSYICFVTN